MDATTTIDVASEAAQGPAPEEVTERGPATSQETVTQAEPEIQQPASPTLEDIIAQRAAQRQGDEAKPHVPAEPKPAEPAPAPEPEAPKPEADDAEKQRIWDLYKSNPSKLIEDLKSTAAPEETPPADPETPSEENKPFVAQEYTQEVLTHANTMYASRPSITLGGIFGGDEVLAELGINDGDLTDSLTEFVQKTIAPQLAQILAVSAYQREQFENSQKTLSPVINNAKDAEIAKIARGDMEAAFPALKTDAAAIEHFHKTFAEFAPRLYDSALLENPQSNTKEYAKILKGIAALAARDYATPPPAPSIEPKPAPPTPTSPAMSPAPAPVAATYRNQFGQFAEKNPTTLQAANDARAKALMEQFRD